MVKLGSFAAKGNPGDGGSSGTAGVKATVSLAGNGARGEIRKARTTVEAQCRRQEKIRKRTEKKGKKKKTLMMYLTAQRIYDLKDPGNTARAVIRLKTGWGVGRGSGEKKSCSYNKYEITKYHPGLTPLHPNGCRKI